MSGLAPVNHYGTQNSTRAFPAELYNEVPLFDPATSTSREREMVDTLSEIYSVIIALDHVEKAYLRDCVSSAQYTSTVNKLLAQYKVYLSDAEVRARFVDLRTFADKYHVVASSAIMRLEKGIPVTMEHPVDDNAQLEGGGAPHQEADPAAALFASGKSGKSVAEATGNFITLIDALKLNYRAKDQLHPLLAELLLSINKVTKTDFEHRSKLVQWIVKINKMDVDATLTDAEIRELIYELEMAYKSFYTLLE
ncbi:ESCRT-I subunit protein VPS28 KNAG_0A02050 [Huiozyma naganishii CBS 8797]|uniref:Vacuolar protein sorting-associated protein 28 n=1 Tax=Huiozyma naganishii (strain ATCC MYA-139 / BCRC 22969 / CBS 8797 / KCTC 17520 / NBRC 10181 / NCYC 3082 / Yp74L-3) TaxID=1071383 RepID=J7S1Y7_HUIN7|nr:hypothetical protein KNAG_0A02050 [Kazachstania naganishii CBS 8797]CCK67894.1 hypothetical protein KNAG_0A02050 [Kazachstania naganishii CBS 8797]